MKTALLLILSTLWRSPKKHFFTPLLIVAWSGANTAQEQAPVTVGTWGADGYGLTNVPVAAQSGVTAIAAGENFNVALKSDGSVVAWGVGTVNNPGEYLDYGQSIVPAGLSGVTEVAVGQYHTVALKSNGSVVAWGAGAIYSGGGESPDYTASRLSPSRRKAE